MKKILFIDRDGTIIKEPADEQVDSLDKLEFYPGAITALSKIAAELDFELVMVTNQDGLGTASFPEEHFWPAQNKMLATLAGEGVYFKDIYIDSSFPEENKPTRKPGIGMLTTYTRGGFDLTQSFVIGDRETDIQLAENLGAQAIFIGSKSARATSLTTTSWQEIYYFLKQQKRKTTHTRKTAETAISIELTLEGTGKADINTGLGFFNHMLEQIAKHSSCDISIQVIGDLHIDEHHTIEDTGLALGEAFLKALGSKKGIERYGFLLPMDDALAQVALDFSGRSWLVWEADFKREKIGDMPTEMFSHFFKSFSDAARCNLNIKASGENEHHKIESIFKALGKCIKAAVKRNPHDAQIPSTKGVL